METSAATAGKPGRPSFAPGNNANPLGRAARAKREAAEREAEAAALLADLGHPPAQAERLLIDEAAACVVEARRLRKLGRSTIELTRMVDRIVGRLGLGRPAEAPVVDVSRMLGGRR
jgi:hypothetical protein